ncbi:hypothetical protein LIER_38204 [Lithospermum erythrorhizon]|uniref:Protein COFACTOR ASSEMBLY OF COMPLEX C SUBUNIT B CCB3, chloroplastic n=1 Tax=Lithospermum erythrorhizon TaxID=34254 RepID=A0AAV3PW26_LITER
MMTISAAASTGIGLSSPWNFKKLDNNFGTQKPKWIISPNSALRVIRMTASFDENPKTFTLQKSEEAFTIAKGNHSFSFRRNTKQRFLKMQCNAFSALNHSVLPVADQLQIKSMAASTPHFFGDIPYVESAFMQDLFLIDLDAATAKTLIGLLGPFLSAFGFLFILRIVMSWYPKLPVEKFPYVIAYVPTEPLLAPTRKLIPPLAGVDVTPVVWFGLLSFLNEILVGPQGLLVFLSQQV